MSLSAEEKEFFKNADLDDAIDKIYDIDLLSKLQKDYLAVSLRNIVGLMETGVYVTDIYRTTSLSRLKGCSQQILGDRMMYTGYFGVDDALTSIATAFIDDEYTEANEDCLDAMAEFLNVSNGIFVADLSDEGIELDLEPPVMLEDGGDKEFPVSSDVVSLSINGNHFDIVVSTDCDFM